MKKHRNVSLLERQPSRINKFEENLTPTPVNGQGFCFCMLKTENMVFSQKSKQLLQML